MSYYYFASSNPCLCTPSVSNPCPDDCNCLKVCHIAINALSDEAVGPCAKTGTIDLSDTDTYPHDFCACGVDPVKWAIEAWDKEFFINASINSTTGVLTWITGDESTANSYGCITICVSCGDLKVYSTVTIGVKNLCSGCTGDDCNNCDPCTGIITMGSVDSSIQSAVNSANTNISGS